MKRSGELDGAEVEILGISGLWVTLVILEPVHGFRKGERLYMVTCCLVIRTPCVIRCPFLKSVIRTPVIPVAGLVV